MRHGIGAHEHLPPPRGFRHSAPKAREGARDCADPLVPVTRLGNRCADSLNRGFSRLSRTDGDRPDTERAGSGGTVSIRTSGPGTARRNDVGCRTAVIGANAPRAAERAITVAVPGPAVSVCPTVRRPPGTAASTRADARRHGSRPPPRPTARERAPGARSRRSGSCRFRRWSSSYGGLFPGAPGGPRRVADSPMRTASWRMCLNAPHDPSVPRASQAPPFNCPTTAETPSPGGREG